MHVLGGGVTESEGAMCALLISLITDREKISFTITCGVDIACSICYVYMYMYTTV